MTLANISNLAGAQPSSRAADTPAAPSSGSQDSGFRDLLFQTRPEQNPSAQADAATPARRDTPSAAHGDASAAPAGNDATNGPKASKDPDRATRELSDDAGGAPSPAAGAAAANAVPAQAAAPAGAATGVAGPGTLPAGATAIDPGAIATLIAHAGPSVQAQAAALLEAIHANPVATSVTGPATVAAADVAAQDAVAAAAAAAAAATAGATSAATATTAATAAGTGPTAATVAALPWSLAAAASLATAPTAAKGAAAGAAAAADPLAALAASAAAAGRALLPAGAHWNTAADRSALLAGLSPALRRALLAADAHPAATHAATSAAAADTGTAGGSLLQTATVFAAGATDTSGSTPATAATQAGTLLPQLAAAAPTASNASAAGSNVAAAAPTVPGWTLTTPLGAAAWAADFSSSMAQWGQRIALSGKTGDRLQLQIQPPELGPISIHLQVSGGIADASFAAAQMQTRQAIESALPLLAQALADAGIALGHSSVGADAGGAGNFSGGEAQGFGSSAAVAVAGIGGSGPQQERIASSTPTPAGASDRLLDTYV